MQYDVVIIGGGVAGCTTALSLLLNNNKLKIAVVEKGQILPENKKIGETLTPQATIQLQNLGIWNRFLESNFKPSYGSSSSWGKQELYTNEYIYSPYGYGWNLDRLKFDLLMREEAKKKGVQFIYDTTFLSFEYKENNWKIKGISFNEKIELNARVCVDASGRKAILGTNLGIEKIRLDRLVGIYQFFEKKENQSVSQGILIEATEDGWWYSTCLPNEQYVLAFMTDADIATDKDLKNQSSFEKFWKHSRYIKERVGKLTSISEIQLVSAQTQRLEKTSGEGWIAVGDAASTYDPVSSMGIYKALVMGQLGAFAILDFLKGDLQGFKKYDAIVTQDFEQYLNKKATYYSEEKRFAKNLFWQRRQINNLNPNKHEKV